MFKLKNEEGYTLIIVLWSIVILTLIFHISWMIFPGKFLVEIMPGSRN